MVEEREWMVGRDEENDIATLEWLKGEKRLKLHPHNAGLSSVNCSDWLFVGH